VTVDTGSFSALTAEVSALREAVQDLTRMRIVIDEVFQAGVRAGGGTMPRSASQAPRRVSPGPVRHLRAVDSQPAGGAL
jgi:hypothetical protein